MRINTAIYKQIKLLKCHITTLKRMNNILVKNLKHLRCATCSINSDFDGPDLTDRIHTIAFAVEYELLEQAMFAKIGFTYNNLPRIRVHLQNMADIHGGWLAYVSDSNNLLGEMRGELTIPYRSPIVTELMKKMPAPDPKSSNEYYKFIWDYIHEENDASDLPFQ